MSIAKISAHKWLIFIACVIFGTLLGIFFQHFETTVPIFKDIANFRIAVRKVDLLALSFGFDFALRMNLGTFVGGVVGLLFIR
ncbi:MAG: hypothetical protein LBS75_07980 [Synergistaceae bacterium]|nr:hypothetical protein [Synergistaceae bacterium]